MNKRLQANYKNRTIKNIYNLLDRGTFFISFDIMFAACVFSFDQYFCVCALNLMTTFCEFGKIFLYKKKLIRVILEKQFLHHLCRFLLYVPQKFSTNL